MLALFFSAVILVLKNSMLSRSLLSCLCVSLLGCFGIPEGLLVSKKISRDSTVLLGEGGLQCHPMRRENIQLLCAVT